MGVTVVAGGGGDIGREIVSRVRAAGDRVAVWDLAAADDAAAATASSPQGAPDLVLHCDITDVAAVDRAAEQTSAALGPVTALVNASGVSQYDDFLELPPEQFDRIIAIDLIGPANTVRAVLPGMLDAGAGTVVNICSIWSKRSGVKRTAYVAAKWGLLGLTKCFSDEFRDRGVRFCAVSPGPVLTQMTQPFADPEEAKTWMKAADVAEAVQFLLSPQGSTVVGGELELYGWGLPAGRDSKECRGRPGGTSRPESGRSAKR